MQTVTYNQRKRGITMNDTILGLLSTFIPILATIITSFIIVYIKAKIKVENLNELAKWVKYRVQASEMIFTGKQSGATKKEYVTNFITDFLHEKRVTITKKQLELLLESSVKELTLQVITNSLSPGI